MSRRNGHGAPPVVVFSTGEEGHFRQLRPLIADLARAGSATHVLTHPRYAAAVRAEGGIPVDMLGRHPLDAADGESIPFPSRFVTYAARYAAAVGAEVAALRPAVVIHETFSVIGRVVASALALPAVNVCTGHNVQPERAAAAAAAQPGARVSPECAWAVTTLREEHGLEDASPFCYVSGLSPHLNVYCEPPAYLDERDRETFEPIAFYGSLPSGAGVDEPPRARADRDLHVYVSFGTVVWRYWAREALAALRSIAAALGGMPGVRAVIGLGGAEVAPGAIESLRRPNVRVESWVDQWSELAAADVCITHNGLNSTHEAVYHRVPMISYPFFGDQPGLARRCRELGLALPLTDAPVAPVSEETVRTALARFRAAREPMTARIEEARRWELETVAQRESVIRRIVDLAAVPA